MRLSMEKFLKRENLAEGPKMQLRPVPERKKKHLSLLLRHLLNSMFIRISEANISSITIKSK